MDATIAALLGVAIGTVGSLGGVWIQERHRNKRERLKLATDLGLADHDRTVEFAKASRVRTRIPPMSAFVMYHADFLDALANKDVTPETIRRLQKKHEQLMEHYPDPQREAHSGQENP